MLVTSAPWQVLQVSLPNTSRRVFYKLLDRADIPKFRFHDIRHTCAGLLLSRGESVYSGNDSLRGFRVGRMR